jgi:hypothetical protein
VVTGRAALKLRMLKRVMRSSRTAVPLVENAIVAILE